MKKTGINYLKFALDKDNKCPMLFETAEMLQMETMDKFSQWIKDEKYKLSEHTGLWGKYLFAEERTVKFSELYQMFLKSKEAW